MLLQMSCVRSAMPTCSAAAAAALAHRDLHGRAAQASRAECVSPSLRRAESESSAGEPSMQLSLAPWHGRRRAQCG